MNNISQITDCANCGCCENLCPHRAVTVKKDDVFYYPVIDEKRCVECGVCLQRCPVRHLPDADQPIAAYGGWSKNNALVMTSSSGGLFGELAQQTLAGGGVVFGAAYAPDVYSVSVQPTGDVPLAALQKSKYVESDAGCSFAKIKTFLREGKPVLFCATPCQVAGLKRFLGKEYQNLLTCDFACGGLPSHKMFREYVEMLERKYRAKATSVDFRPKTHGWKQYAVLVRFQNGKQYNRLGKEDSFIRCFLYGKLSVRDNCLNYVFSDRHAADITLADFWLHKKLSDMQNDSGISLVLCASEKGKQAIAGVKDRLVLQELDVEKAAYNHTKTTAEAAQKSRHDAFIAAYRELGFKGACQKLSPLSASDAFKGRLLRITKKKDYYQ